MDLYRFGNSERPCAAGAVYPTSHKARIYSPSGLIPKYFWRPALRLGDLGLVTSASFSRQAVQPLLCEAARHQMTVCVNSLSLSRSLSLSLSLGGPLHETMHATPSHRHGAAHAPLQQIIELQRPALSVMLGSVCHAPHTTISRNEWQVFNLHSQHLKGFPS